MPEGSRAAPRDDRLPSPDASRAAPRSPSAGSSRRLAELTRRREALLFDVEQGELAAAESNPWSDRIALLEETLQTIEADRATLDVVPSEPAWPVPPVPVESVTVSADEPASIRFTINGEPFHYAEEIDWDQRGGAIVRGDLQRQQGNIANIVPAETPDEQREPLERHLAASLLTFATDLRDRALEGQPLPENPTLRDLASPCPDCGGWRDWAGRCATCAERDLQRRGLHAEAVRIQDERAAEAETRHRLIERLPVSRRRLADAEANLVALQDQGP
ncbi:MAG TPA: hypothetical protein VGR16_12635 [Thermomicrobiales bacterium]|nr:hypothetical protein [Thermomicrobiales bacterium]